MQNKLDDLENVENLNLENVEKLNLENVEKLNLNKQIIEYKMDNT